jgi:hypothetical protein
MRTSRPEQTTMNDGPMSPHDTRYAWPAEGLTRVPDWVYTDDAVYQREVERIFHGRTWNYVALEAEIPNAGDFIRSNVGPTPVVAARAQDGTIHVMENRCAHRAAEFCRELTGNAKEFVCPMNSPAPCAPCHSAAALPAKAACPRTSTWQRTA